MTAAWQSARLIPVTGIGSDSEAEQRATSALLAVLSVVRPFSKSILAPMGASRADRAQVETFIEPIFKIDGGKTVRPDGLVQVRYGSSSQFTALVEVKTGSSPLDADQINSYWDIARRESFDAVLTISNEISPSPGVHPTPGLKEKANSKVKVHHWSWTRILTEAVKHKVHRGVDDPEQAWILAELIRYLEHPASGAMNFDDMGPNWVQVRDGARTGTLTKGDESVVDIAQRWDQLLGFVSLKLGADIGSDVQEIAPRSHQQDPSLRTKHFVESLSDLGALDGTLRIPNTAGDLDILVDLKGRLVTLAVSIDAPSDKRLRGQVSWLLRQLQTAPSSVVIEGYARNSRQPVTVGLAKLREDPSLLVLVDKKELSRFRVVHRCELGMNRKAGKKPGFVQSVADGVEGFYGDILQNLASYQAAAPRLRVRHRSDNEQQTGAVSPRPASATGAPNMAETPEQLNPSPDDTATSAELSDPSSRGLAVPDAANANPKLQSGGRLSPDRDGRSTRHDAPHERER